MPCAARFPFDGQLQGGAHHILDMNEGPHGMAAAMELHGLTGAGAQQGAGNDAIELLARAIHNTGMAQGQQDTEGLMGFNIC